MLTSITKLSIKKRGESADCTIFFSHCISVDHENENEIEEWGGQKRTNAKKNQVVYVIYGMHAYDINNNNKIVFKL